MKALLVILWTVAAALAGTGWTATAEDVAVAAYKKELEHFAGTWQLIASEKDGVKAPDTDLKQLKVVFHGDQYTMERAGKTIEEGWVAIDPARKPRVIDIYATKPDQSKVVMAIYEWDRDDKFRLCATHPGTDQTRPKQFSTSKGIGHVLVVCKKVKEK
jgi:uncharacterized protein (TIGR03067 family)